MLEHSRLDPRERGLLVAPQVPGPHVLLESVPLLVCAGDGRVGWASREGADLVGLAPGRASLLDVIDQEDRDRVAHELERLGAHPGAKRRTEFGLRRADGSRRHLEADLTSVAGSSVGDTPTTETGTNTDAASTCAVVVL